MGTEAGKGQSKRPGYGSKIKIDFINYILYKKEMTWRYNNWISYICLVGWIFCLPSIVKGNGHGFCNSSTAYRIVRHHVGSDPEILDLFPDLATRLDHNQDLSVGEVHAMNLTYRRIMDEGSERIRDLANIQANSRGSLSNPMFYTRNNALTMDYVMSWGVHPEVAYNNLLFLGDDAADIQHLVDAGSFGGDVRSMGELIRSGARSLRWNGEEVPATIRNYFNSGAEGGRNLDQLNTNELMTQLEAHIPEADFAELAGTESIEQSVAHLEQMQVGDTALVSFTSRFRLSDQSITPPRRFTFFLQQISPIRFSIYNPAGGQFPSSSFLSDIIRGDRGVEGFREYWTDFQGSLFNSFASQVDEAIQHGSALEVDLSESLMESIFGMHSPLPSVELMMDQFITITHQPPYLP